MIETKKTIKQVAENSALDATLVRAVVKRVGRESLEDVANHGAAGGFPGFTYYKDTVAFFKKHRKAIVAIVERMADDFGESPVDMVAGFNCLGGRDDRKEYVQSVCRCLYGCRLTDDDTNVANALAWFALEEVARVFCDD